MRTITRHRALMLCGILVASAVVVLGVLLTQAASSHSSTAPAWLRSIAAQTAQRDGDAAPTSVQWTLTTERAAAPLVGLSAATAPDDAPVYVVVMTGRFTDYFAFIPAGASPPTGTCIAFTVDATSHMIRDFGITGGVDTSSVGQMETLALH